MGDVKNKSKKEECNKKWERKPLDIKTAGEQPILKVGLPNFR